MKPHAIVITNKLMLDMNSCRMKYQAEVDLAKKQKKDENVKKQNEILQKEINELKEKKEHLVKTAATLDEEFVALVEKAEKEQKKMLVTKANAMKRKSE